MLKQNSLHPSAPIKSKSKRLGRGNASGKGTYCGRGMNGQNCRSGGGVPAWFEGGQTPLFRRMPKWKGFSNARFSKSFNIVNLSQIEKLASAGVSEINYEVLVEKGIVRNNSLPLKILGDGEITTKVTISVNKISAGAKEKIEKAGGKVEVL